MRETGSSRWAKFAWLAAGVSVTALWTSDALAGETTTYVYDALGRLMSVSTPRAPSTSSSATTVSYDAAGNRVSYAVATGTSTPPTPPPPPSPPPSSNHAPVANPITGLIMPKCGHKDVFLNSYVSDVDGDTLSLTSASATGDMSAYVEAALEVGIDAGSTTGSKTINYTISDGHGGTASSTITLTVSGGSCV
jgi:YD repeat-containing protein